MGFQLEEEGGEEGGRRGGSSTLPISVSAPPPRRGGVAQSSSEGSSVAHGPWGLLGAVFHPPYDSHLELEGMLRKTSSPRQPPGPPNIFSNPQ